MSGFPVIKITPQEVSSYQIEGLRNNRYDQCSRWFHTVFEEYLPIISAFRLTKNFSVPTDEFQKTQIQSQNLLSNKNILPLSVRFIDQAGTYYIERPPFKIKINYKNARAMYSGPVVDDLEIWIPWTLMTIPASFYNHFDPRQVRIFYSHKPLENFKDKYLYSFLPNTYRDGSICWSQSFQKLISLDQTKNQLGSFDATYWHSMIINDYMMGGWNNDLQSVNANNLFQHLQTHNYTHCDDDFKNDKALLNKVVPMIHKFIHMEQYPDLSSKVNGLLINKFGYSKQLADYITDFNSISKTAGQRRTRRSRSSANIHDPHGYEYSKILSFFSTLSLSETLDFYSQYQKYLTYNGNVDRYSICNTSTSFTEIIQENMHSLESKSLEIPLNLPISSVTRDNIEMFELSSSKYKSTMFYAVITNLNLSQKRKICENLGYGNFPDTLLAQMFDQFNISVAQFLDLLDNSDNVAKGENIYVSIDAKTSQIAIHDKAYFSNLISTIAQTYVDKIEQYKSLPKTSSEYKRYKKYSYYIEETNIQDQFKSAI